MDKSITRPTTRPAGRRVGPIVVARAVLLCAGMLVLGGCMHGGDAITHHRYALDGALPTAANNDNNNDNGATQHSGDSVLKITRIAVPQWLAGTAMYYRLAYRAGNRLAAYVYSDWAAPPAQLLETIIQDRLAADGGWQAVVGSGNPATADMSLHLRVEDFSQVFEQPGHSAGVIEATATLIDNHAERVVAQRHFSVQVAAPTADAQGGAKALAAASRQLAIKLQHWSHAAAVGGGRGMQRPGD